MLRCHSLLPGYLLLVTAILLATCGRGTSLCRQDQRAALLRLKASFHIDATATSWDCPWFLIFERNSTLSSWKVDTNCCTWEGVTCDGTSGNITGLDLSYLCISGNLSSSEIFKLTSLRFLSLAYNKFYAWPSPGFEQLTDLKYLDLSYSSLSGALPVEDGQLSNLVSLNLSGLDLNDLSLETLIDSLGSLQHLYLYDVSISVSPTNLSHASSTNITSYLKGLSMGWCTITSGRFDAFLTNAIFNSKLANLVTLDLSGFDLKNVSLHALIGSLGSLQQLYLENVIISISHTDLAHGSSIKSSSRLKELSMCQFSTIGGHLDTVFTDPQFRSMLTNLVTLELSGSDLGNLSLHDLIDSLGNLQKLHLYDVSISFSQTDLAHGSSTNTTSGVKELTMQWCTITSGRIDTVLTKLPFLSELILDGTNISGPTPMPEHFAEFSSLAVLSLVNCGLTGTFPSWIFRIRSLESLDVSGNENLCGELPEFIEGCALQELVLTGTNFSGRIPESIGNLQNLTLLDLSYCQFHGLIPSFAQGPMNIQLINLYNNNLTGPLPSDGYLSLHNLIYLYLGNNTISGVIPASLFSHPSLEILDLSQNNFTGRFLLYPNISSSLREIDVSFNRLQGPLPKLLLEFVGLGRLDLSSNNLTGTVDLSFIKNYKRLYCLSLSHNKLSVVEEDGNHSYVEYPVLDTLGLASCNLSYLPNFLMQQNYYDLDISNNNIGGNIPNWMWGIGHGLNLSHNLFTSIDTNLSDSSIVDLDLNSNKIEGALPLPPSRIYRLDYSNNQFNNFVTSEFWSHISYVGILSLANNSLTGEVSHLICKQATVIRVLDLSFNSFSGFIPPCLLKDNKGLEVLNLRGNKFNGSLPQGISEDCALQIIDLNGNELKGKLPVSMVNCRMLQVLDLGNNLIVDTYPEWLGALPLLKVLVLKSNRFHGPIDYFGKNKKGHPFFPELQVLDLSSIFFNGSIHKQFIKQLKAMMVSSGSPSMYVTIIETRLNDTNYRLTVTLKGQETTLVQILSVFMYLDLSNNNFEGIIPNEIGDLKLLKQLNLSRNSFTGGIPPHIVNMLQLETLDLSFNQLSGEIPPAMAVMSFLEVLNLSYNHLSGMIPQSSQFLTFPNTSFLGNDGLCGKPLTRQCDTNHAPSAAATPDSAKELNWEFLSVEVGVVSDLAIAFVTTLLWGNGRRWVYWHVDKFWLQVLQPWISSH